MVPDKPYDFKRLDPNSVSSEYVFTFPYVTFQKFEELYTRNQSPFSNRLPKFTIQLAPLQLPFPAQPELR